jgi:hypothetical protein
MSSLEGFLIDVAFWAVAGLVVLLYYARKRHVHTGVLMKYLYGPILGWMVLASSTRLFIADSRAQIWVFACSACRRFVAGSGGRSWTRSSGASTGGYRAPHARDETRRTLTRNLHIGIGSPVAPWPSPRSPRPSWPA